jgi:hypothetical protein
LSPYSSEGSDSTTSPAIDRALQALSVHAGARVVEVFSNAVQAATAAIVALTEAALVELDRPGDGTVSEQPRFRAALLSGSQHLQPLQRRLIHEKS